MQKLFKLTKQDGTTHNGYPYGEVGKVHTKPKKENPQLCSSDMLHAYRNKNLAFLLNPIHADISNPRLWEIKGDVVCHDFGKVGSLTQEVVKELKLPKWVGSEKEGLVRVAFAVLCAEAVLHHFEDKMEGDDRPRKAIEAVKEYLKNPAAAEWAAWAAAWAAADAAADAAAWAAAAARAAADAAARAAADAAAWAAWAARAAADAAAAARAAARAAAAAARAAADAAAADAAAADAAAGSQEIDFGKLADQAVKMIFGK